MDLTQEAKVPSQIAGGAGSRYEQATKKAANAAFFVIRRNALYFSFASARSASALSVFSHENVV